ncbi:helix-turn-helix domain-containing protein [Paenibacillus sepulcri]|uniref:Helix-turn-helix domain-containing protein n=1 Tax=Paenibacillus sepulcri TaxID=359917 RepID=A0ABS7C230_9BACL|nr:helix-turn-helix domain-containing protein [Paenibacillus sepulcri]
MVNWIEALVRQPGSMLAANRGKYLYKLIWLGCISVCVPVLLASLVYYQFSMNRMNQQMLSESRSSLTMMKDRSERILQGIEQESLQLALDPALTNFFTKPDQESGIIWHQNILDKIAMFKNTNSFIDEIFFYNRAEETVLSNRYGTVDKEKYPYGEDIDRLILDGNLSQWTIMPAGKKDGYITFARLLPILGSGKAQGVLAFEIETSAISKFLQTDTIIVPKEKDLFVLNYQKLFQNGSTGSEDIYSKLNQMESLEKIRTSGKTTDSFFAEGIDGDRAQYLYQKNVFGRTYVTVIPEKIIAGQINWIRGVTLLVLLFFIAVGVLLTYFNTKKAYNPIGELIKHSRTLSFGRIQNKDNEFDYIKECLDFLNNEAEKLGTFMEQIEPSLREKCLQQLLSGDYVRNDSLIRDSITYGISVDSTNVVLIAEVENISKDKRFLPDERSIIAFAIANVMQELLQSDARIQGYVIPFQGRGVALLQFGQDTELSVMRSQTLEYANSVCASLKNVLSFDVSVGVGRFYSHTADVPVSYKEAEIALQNRIFRLSEHVLFIDDMERSKKQALFRYPQELETAIVEALETGDPGEAGRHLSQFSETLRSSHSYILVYQSYYVLLSAVIHSLERQGGSLVDILEHNLFGHLKNKQTSREIYEWFVESIFPLYKWLAENYRSETGQSAVKQVCRHIKENCNNDLSLVSCADMVGMSPSYLSRLFKKEMGMNFLDFVVDCKVVEAKRLLLESDRTVSDIATAIGYSERNLNRIFQRYSRMTPSAFRSRNR